MKIEACPEPPVSRVGRLTASVHWHPLLSGRLVADVLLERPQVDIDLARLRQEAKDGVPVNERGGEEALQEATPSPPTPERGPRLASAPAVPVETTAPEQENQNDDQQNGVHDEYLPFHG